MDEFCKTQWVRIIRTGSVGLSDQRSRINSDRVQTSAEEIPELHRMNRCWTTGVSGRHRINRRKGIGASCSVSVEENQEAPDDPTRASEERRTNRRIVYQRTCLGNQGALLRTGLSDALRRKSSTALKQLVNFEGYIYGFPWSFWSCWSSERP